MPISTAYMVYTGSAIGRPSLRAKENMSVLPTIALLSLLSAMLRELA